MTFNTIQKQSIEHFNHCSTAPIKFLKSAIKEKTEFLGTPEDFVEFVKLIFLYIDRTNSKEQTKFNNKTAYCYTKTILYESYNMLSNVPTVNEGQLLKYIDTIWDLRY
tara:strand:- start:338 stop:661 length:324 start_codon:yes stop_codon:yes gene_type:complete